MTTVYYNFPEIVLGTGINAYGEILLVDNRNTNIKLNDVNYTAYAVYITGSDTNNSLPEHFIVKCYSDVNDMTSKCVYVAIPLAQKNSEKEFSDVDNIISQPDKETKFELNKYIKENGQCAISDVTEAYVTITLLNQTIPIQYHVGNDFYSKSNLDEIKINTETANGVLKKQDMDWIMTCDLLTEDGEVKTNANTPSTETTITLFFMTIMISVCAYIAAPVLYVEMGMQKMAERVLNGNHYSINIFWAITMLLMAFLTFVQGVITNVPIYYFMAMSMMFSYVTSTRGVLKVEGISNKTGDSFATNRNPFDVYTAIFFGECYSSIGRIAKMCLFATLVMIFLFGVIPSMVLKSVTAFTVNILLFLLFSLLQLGGLYYFNRAANL